MNRSLLLTILGLSLVASHACRSLPGSPVSPTPTSPPTASSSPTPGLTPTPSATTTPVPATAVPTSTPTGTPSGPCELTAATATTAYQRPFPEAQIFGTLDADLPIRLLARSPDGWYGFDPGVAQAANIGVFRLRWLPPDSAISLTGACSEIPIVEGPPPGICFTMPMGPVEVYSEPDLSGGILGSLEPGDYAAVEGRTIDGAWARLDLDQGSNPLNGKGWIEGWAINLNGPCDPLPILP